jgi:hypothetical protein
VREAPLWAGPVVAPEQVMPSLPRNVDAAAGGPSVRARSPLAVGRVVEVDVVGLFWARGRQPHADTVTATITAMGPGFISVRADMDMDEGAVEFTVSSLRLRR